ncbi:unnamed protein product, partial [Acidithrix sp. C25]
VRFIESTCFRLEPKYGMVPLGRPGSTLLQMVQDRIKNHLN